MNQVWAITTYRREATRQFGQKTVRDRRTVGLFETRQEAVECVLANHGDLEEAGWYQFAVVEPLPLGLYPVNDPSERTWFEYHQTAQGWAQLPELPAALREEHGIGVHLGDFTNWTEVG